MSHDRGCFRCFEDHPFHAARTCTIADCPYKEKAMTNPTPPVPIKAGKVINRIKRTDVDAFEKYVTFDNALNVYQDLAQGSAIYPGQGSPTGLMYTALKLNGEAGEFAEHVGKAMRDDNYGDSLVSNTNELTPERKLALKKELGDNLWYIAAAAKELGFKLSEIAHENLDKLCSRGERNKLQGSGDDR